MLETKAHFIGELAEMDLCDGEKGAPVNEFDVITDV